VRGGHAGGWFTGIGGTSQANLAAVDATTGAVTSWAPQLDSEVMCMALSGATLYVGGRFSTSVAWRGAGSAPSTP